MYEGARQLPTMHVSIRVPWHDSGWNGTVCSNPCDNTSCLVLKRIADDKDDDFETKFAGKSWNGEEIKTSFKKVACATERGAFMADFDYTLQRNHPYNYDDRYKHVKTTDLQYEAHSAAAVPFAWMKKNEKNFSCEKANIYNIGYDPDLEPENLGLGWVQHYHNQMSMLDSFFGAIKPKESLVFFYAKNTPLTDDPRRVIIGIGKVLSVGEHVEYNYEPKSSDKARCVLWERNIHHSIRNDIKDGFLFPYQELLELSKTNPDIDLSKLILHAPDEYREAFSMGTEHVSHDQAISVLLSCSSILHKIEEHLGNKYTEAYSWINDELNRIWNLRGPFPGFGSMLTAMGIECGTLLAYEVQKELYKDGSKEIREPWSKLTEILKNPKSLPDYLFTTIGENTQKIWEGLSEKRRDLFKLLSHFDISTDQANRWFDSDKRKKSKIDVSDEEIINNPYIIYEADRAQYEAIPVDVIDRGLFSYHKLKNNTIPKPSHCSEPIDKRRGRALIIDVLENKSTQAGHTLLPQSWLVDEIYRRDILPKCSITKDWVDTFSEFLKENLVETKTIDEQAWQLNRYAESKEIISTEIKKRINGKRHEGEHNWRELINKELPPLEQIPDRKAEEMAREEKAKALEEVYRSRFSVLIGPAGTGKTSLLKALLKIESVAKGGVLLLAPTGKARVQMQKQTKEIKALTLAQFLLKRKRYHAKTFTYKITKDSGTREAGYKTIIIDESSMLTEDQLAATFDAIKNVERLILVGDPRQLPPIGAGRPFVDIIKHISELPTEDGQKLGYAELETVRRQSISASIKNNDKVRDDTLLSQWFTDGESDPSSDEAWQRLASNEAHGIKAIQWESDSDLQEKLLVEINSTTHKIANSLKFKDFDSNDNYDEISCFEISLGGNPFKGEIYFNISRPEANIEEMRVESWQILSPVRAGESGVNGLNRWIQKEYRTETKNRWVKPNDPRNRKTCHPIGTQGIFYGDKVINLVNKDRDCYPKNDGKKGYVVNGEIGLAVGQFKNRNWNFKGLPWKLEVEFATQPRIKYDYYENNFGENEPPLELAYALTIHKSQGSEFGKTFVIVPNPCRLLSRELLYTALTRQREEIVLFHQGSLRDFMKYTNSEHSDTAQRITNLFATPNPIEYGEKFLEEGLIYLTKGGEIVRSKSEKIIADLLHHLDVDYEYEKPFEGKDGKIRYPDFTIEDAASGQSIILEHLGMLSKSSYKTSWKKKLEWYRAQGVLPQNENKGNAAILLTTTEEDIKDTSNFEKTIKDLLGL